MSNYYAKLWTSELSAAIDWYRYFPFSWLFAANLKMRRHEDKPLMQLVLSFNGTINFLTAEALLCDWAVQCRNITARLQHYLLQFSADVCGLSILYGAVVLGFLPSRVFKNWCHSNCEQEMEGTQVGSVNCVFPACKPLFFLKKPLWLRIIRGIRPCYER